MSNNQKGFSAVETLLVIVLVAVLAFGGWFVWSRHQDADKNETKKAANSADQKSSSASKAADADFLTVDLNQSLGFKEQKIKFQLSGDIKDAYFVTGSAGTSF